MASNTTDQVLECRQLLANFFHGIKHAHACWFPIVLREGSSKANDHGLSSLMSLDYYDTYLPLMMLCGLVIKQCINRKGSGSFKSMEVPSIFKGLNKFGYTWDDFLAEYGLSFVELAYVYIEKRKTYFIRIGEFKGCRFTIQEQLNGKVLGVGQSPQLYYGGCQVEQLKLIHLLQSSLNPVLQMKLLLHRLLIATIIQLHYSH
jgi:hypothetical protein